MFLLVDKFWELNFVFCNKKKSIFFRMEILIYLRFFFGEEIGVVKKDINDFILIFL